MTPRFVALATGLRIHTYNKGQMLSSAIQRLRNLGLLISLYLSFVVQKNRDDNLHRELKELIQ